MKKLVLLVAGALAGVSACFSQETFPVNGPHNDNHNYYAFTNAKIYVDHQTTIDNGTLLIRDGKIVKADKSVSLPAGTVTYDLKGKFIYPSLIDAYTSYGMPAVPKKKYGDGPQMESNIKGPYSWNQAIHPETDAAKMFLYNNETAEELRKLGFGTVLSIQRDGIARGTAVLTTLADERENETVLINAAAANYSFDKGSSTQDYPSSLMGAIALLRQTYLDADWYKKTKGRRENNLSLEAWNKVQPLPQIFEVNDKYSVLRADKIGDEFNVQYIIKGSGDEYQRIEDIKQTKAPLIIPVNFPAAYDVEDAYTSMILTLEMMKHWEMAPANPHLLEKNGIPFAITTSDLKDKKEFWPNLQKAINFGLNEKEALKSLTSYPASLLGASDKVGALKPGMFANFIITSGNLFDKKNIIHENWVQGNQYVINDYNLKDIRGTYDLKLNNNSYNLKITGDVAKMQAGIERDTNKYKANISMTGAQVSLSFAPGVDKGTIRLTGLFEEEPAKRITGKGELPDGSWVSWTAAFKTPYVSEDKKDTTAKPKPTWAEAGYPNSGYGWKQLPKQEPVLIQGATVWTNEKEGILKSADVLLQNGKIAKVGENIAVPAGAKVIDGKGKHLSPGIIDEHSHIAISAGVNEGTQSSSAEVRIGDVINPDDINIYRQLSGGVVAAQLLHGSANPVGGQSALIKLRWGQSPEKMKIEGADGFIKFALGENVKQSNWGDRNVIRYPQTRMGVEQAFYDQFTRAKEYQEKWKGFDAAKGKGDMPRRDLELDAIVEILNKKRFITCHSYVQSEISMLINVADSMGFKVNTFTHILEGYKVADKMKAHGVGGSTFSDWWAYKFEVNDAIPYNGAIMNRMGIVTAFNSDDAEMGRRLNQEAAKAVKYGGVSEEEALKFVTLNPAILLHLDNKMGSIKEGKDADLVLWSDHPLSIYAKAEKTFIDGIAYYDSERDKQMREELVKERARLTQKMLAEKSGGEKTQKADPKPKKLYHCDTMEVDYLNN